jgi:hypothetical protein
LPEFNESKKGAEKRKAESFGGLPSPFGVVAQEGQDIFRGDGFPLPVTELGREPCQKVFVVSERVFFSSSSCGNPENASRPDSLCRHHRKLQKKKSAASWFGFIILDTILEPRGETA